MHNSFAMACHDNSAMRLNSKGISTEPYPETKIPQPKLAANGEISISSPRKHNFSSLRIPADPSWPKIPQRRYADNVGDIIDQPCVVTVTGTPRSRTIVRTPTSQTMRGTGSRETVDSSYYVSSNIPVSQPMTQPPKRRPGCIDPRFKRVTTVKSQMTSTEPQEKEHETPTETSRSAHVIPNQVKSTTENVEHSIPEKDTIVKKPQEKSEKPNKVECTEVNAIQTMVEREEGKQLKKQKTDFNAVENCTASKEKNEVQVSPQELTESRNRDKLSNGCELSEKSKFSENLQERSGIANTKKNPQYEYCNVRALTSEACKKSETEANRKFSNDNQCQHSEMDSSPRKEQLPHLRGKFCGYRQKIESYACNRRKNFRTKKLSPNHEINHFRCSGRFKTFRDSKTENSEDQTQSDEDSISLLEDVICRNRCKEHNVIDDKESCMTATTDSEYVEKDFVMKRKTKPLGYYNSAGEDSNFSAKNYQQINFFQTHAECIYNSPKKMEISKNKDEVEREKIGRGRKERDNNKFKQKMKSEQDLSYLQSRKLSQISEPHFNIKQRRCSTSHSKRVFGYPEEKPDITDSEFTFIWPEKQRVRRKSEFKKKSCVNVPHPTDRAELEILKNQNMLIISPRADTDIITDKSNTIPIKTQQLLNETYWEYYNKLKQESCNEGEDPQKQYFRQVAMDAPQIKRKKGDVKNYKNQSELSPPEMRTLERCSIFSSIINKTLDSTPQESIDTLHTDQIFLNTNIKSYSDPTAGTPSVVVNQVQSGNQLDVYKNSSVSSQSDTQVDNGVIRFKTIVFFGLLMYAIIVFLPMVYDYFFYTEYDEYEDLTYIEIALDYVVSSFLEAFDGVFTLMNKIIFRPLFVIFRAPVGNVTTLLEFALSIIMSFRP